MRMKWGKQEDEQQDKCQKAGVSGQLPQTL